MNKAIVPLLDQEEIVTLPEGDIEGDRFILKITFYDTEDDSQCVAKMSLDYRQKEF